MNDEKTTEVLKSAVDKISFISEIVRDWVGDECDVFDTWSPEVRINIFSGIYRNLDDAAGALAIIHEDMEKARAKALRESRERGES